jgi:hypothetical protein
VKGKWETFWDCVGYLAPRIPIFLVLSPVLVPAIILICLASVFAR